MASTERFDELTALAEERAKIAVASLNSVTGPLRAQTNAALAAMFLETARLEQQMLAEERTNRRLDRLTDRIRRLEAKAELDDYPDPFAADDDEPLVAEPWLDGEQGEPVDDDPATGAI